MKNLRHIVLLIALAAFFRPGGGEVFAAGQNPEKGGKYRTYAVAFYNLENLFDTVDDPDNPGDDDFLPDGPYNWTEVKYRKKLHNLATVISKLGREYTPYGPAVIGVSEVENKEVLLDLVREPELGDMGLRVLHHSGPDRRGIDVAFLYNPRLFRLDGYKAFKYRAPASKPDYVTRDALLISGLLAGEKVHFIVGHWPSKYGGESSSVLREAAGAQIRSIIDSLYTEDPSTKLIFMGDLNDNPDDKSVAVSLGAKERREDVAPRGTFNATWAPYAKGIGSLAYQDKWNLYDQIILTEPLISDAECRTLTFWKTEVFNRPFITTKEGKRKGYPHRTFEANTFINGYSDHFPTLVYLIKKEGAE
ncbi:MAG: endonuclease/exonuclease/phosphatase family protein [Porphyromonas sp.]|nr:endonuclease/exonuclease/phosphatase family protein [Bacteroidales bacterium]MDY3099785.1 endonuclease/exonuclease/phosphatase family protein [Porphyromonas sp.]